MALEEIRFFRFEGRQVNVCGVPPFSLADLTKSNWLKVIDSRGQDAVWVPCVSHYSGAVCAETLLGLSYIEDQMKWAEGLVQALNAHHQQTT